MPHPRPLTTWCRLLRLPNLFTVPGDPLAGFMLATGGMLDWRVAGAMATSLLLYSAGLLLNDYFDRHLDARERPERPIPSGAVKASTVLAAGLILLVGGVGVAFAVGHAGAGAVAVALALAVFAYDARLKRIGWLGPLVMGGCRAASVILGATFAFRPMAPPVVIAAATAWAYITAVSVVAAGETSGRRPGWAAHVPGLLLLAGGIAMLRYSKRHIPWPMILSRHWDAPIMPLHSEGPVAGGTERLVECRGMAMAALLTVAIVEAEFNAFRVRRGRLPVPAFVGRIIRAMITVQAAWFALVYRPLMDHDWPLNALLGVALAWLVVRWGAGIASRRFHGS